MRRILPTNRLYCFSPPVMIATIVFELGAALYAAWRYRLNGVGRLTVAILVCLALFQIAEFTVCERVGDLDLARLGFIAITALPPLGIHLAAAIAGKVRQSLPIMVVSYLLGIGFALFFLVVPTGVQNGVCHGNYVIYDIFPGATWWWYGLYYYGLLLLGIILAMSLRRQPKLARSRKQALLWLVVGYLSFLLPTTTVNVLDSATLAGIPSIMCGFAVLLAAVLILRIMPLVGTKK